MKLLKCSKIKKNLKKAVKSKVSIKTFNGKGGKVFSREKKIEMIKECEDNLRKNIQLLLKEGKTAEEIIGFNTSLLVCLTSSEIIKKQNR